MIWSTTTHVGMAVATSSSGTTYVVARYSSPGNHIGESPMQASNSGGGRLPPRNRHHRRDQRESARQSGGRDGIQPPFQRPAHERMQPQSPHQPFPPGPGQYNTMISCPGTWQPPPQSGVFLPSRWLNDPTLRDSPYNPFGPLLDSAHPVSADRSAPKGYCIIVCQRSAG
jgi:hypothetical protein